MPQSSPEGIILCKGSTLESFSLSINKEKVLELKQQERMYSEEEVLKLLISKEENTKDSTKYNGVEYITPEEWFEQFKKK